jgi:hypothetical protein
VAIAVREVGGEPIGKGLKDSARGFNPGLSILKKFRPEGAAGWDVARQNFGTHSETNCLPPFQGDFIIWFVPGVKTRAESFNPFGISCRPHKTLVSLRLSVRFNLEPKTSNL